MSLKDDFVRRCCYRVQSTRPPVSVDHHSLNGTLALPAAFTETVGFELVLTLEPVDAPVGWGLLTVPFGAKVVVEVDSGVALGPPPGQSEAVTMA